MMKKLWIFLCLLAPSFFFLACETDDDDDFDEEQIACISYPAIYCQWQELGSILGPVGAAVNVGGPGTNRIMFVDQAGTSFVISEFDAALQQFTLGAKKSVDSYFGAGNFPFDGVGAGDRIFYEDEYIGTYFFNREGTKFVWQFTTGALSQELTLNDALIGFGGPFNPGGIGALMQYRGPQPIKGFTAFNTNGTQHATFNTVDNKWTILTATATFGGRTCPFPAIHAAVAIERNGAYEYVLIDNSGLQFCVFYGDRYSSSLGL